MQNRYVIDYYYDDGKAHQDNVPAVGAPADEAAVRSIIVDVRPALDSLAAVYHRLRMFPGRMWEALERGFPQVADHVGPGVGYDKGKDGNYGSASSAGAGPGPAATQSPASGLLARLSNNNSDAPMLGAATGGRGLLQQPAMMEAATEATNGAAGQADALPASEISPVHDILKSCSKQFEAECKCTAAAARGEVDPAVCARVQLGLQFCIAERHCPAAAAAFMSALEAGAEDAAMEKVSTTMGNCVDGFMAVALAQSRTDEQ
eukprot:SAG31_NODE_3292_length_4454_cov_2.328588_3_plen_262_part_00